MFTAVPSRIDYIDPWLASYEERLRQMMAQPRRIAYFYALPDTSTFRYRVFNPGLTLAARPDLRTSACWFDLADFARDDAFVRQADVLVIGRIRYDAAVGRLISTARSAGIPVLFDCDDLVFDIDRTHLLIDTLALDQSQSVHWDFWYGVIGRYSATFRACDGFITTNPYLAEQARLVRPGLPVTVLKNYLHPGQQELSTEIFRAKKASGWARDSKIHIGYFSGSPSHTHDFAVASSAIAALMDDDPRIVLRTVGFMEPRGDLARHRDRVDHHPLQDFMNLQRLIGEVEINVAPLQENTFTQCKSELKFFEAAIVGTLTVATPTSTFRASVDHGVTGLLAPAFAWRDRLRQAIAIVEDPGLYGEMAQRAFDQVSSVYGWDRQGEAVVSSVFDNGAVTARRGKVEDAA